MIDKNGYRLNVGIILTNYNQRVFFGKRINKNVWQFPQGGLKNNESHVNGMFRELKEEIGLNKDDVIIAPLTLSATITVKEISTEPTLSSLRVNFEGGERKFSDLFFKSFFAALDKSLFLDQEIQ